MKQIRILLAVAGVAAVAVWTVGAATASAPPAPASAQAAAERTIVDTAVAAGNFETLTTLLKQARLARTLDGDGRFTVFAPTDAAFAKVPSATLERLARNRAKLRSVLLYHVASRKLTARKVVRRRSIRMLNGQRVGIRVRAGKVFVGGARVVTPDVAASNGVIHVINRVLIPR
jgi:uncharacterized surface protein with fasciclin (FAS1) repeats